MIRAAAGCLLAGGLVVAVTPSVHGQTASISPGVWKMVNLGGGGSVPTTGPVIRVNYDRTQRRYLSAEQEPLTLVATVAASCGNDSFEELFLETLGRRLPVSTATLGKGGGGFSGRTTIASQAVTTAALAATGVPDPVQTCNADLKALVDATQYGKAQKGWARKYNNAFAATLVVVCRRPGGKKGLFDEPDALREGRDMTRFPVWIRCGPAGVFKTVTKSRPPRAKKVGVQSVDVFVNPKSNASYKGVCPKKLAFGGSLVLLKSAAAGAVDVRYRYRTHDGATSAVYATSFAKSGTRNAHYWTHEFGAGSPSGSFAAPGGSKGPRVIKGWVDLEVLNASGAVTFSDRAPFQLTCQPRRVSGPPVVTPPSSAPAVAAFAAAAGPALPDLAVLAAQPAPTAATKLRVQVSNRGSGPAPASRLTLFYTRDGTVSQILTDVPPLAPGQERWLIVDALLPLADAEHLTLRINDAGTVDEAEVLNNGHTVK